MSRLLTGLFAALLLLLPAPALALLGGAPTPIMVPPSGGADDGPAFNRALATGRPTYAVRGATYNVTTGIAATTGGELHLAGATLVSNVTSYATGHSCASTWPATICAGYQGTAQVTLSTPATVGASTFSVTSAAGLVVGGYAHYIEAAGPEWAQTFVVTGISGTTITVGGGKTMAWAYPTSTPIYANPTLVSGFRLYGEGATINVTSTGQARGIQLQGCQECKVSDVTVTGLPAQTCFSWDLAGTHDEVTGLTCAPRAPVVSKAVSNGGPGLVRLTVDSTAGILSGASVTVQGVGGATGANISTTVTVINGTTLDLVGSTFGGTYTSGGVVLVTQEGLKSEACERCTYRDIHVTGAAAGLDPFCSIRSLYDRVSVSAPCSAGITLGGNGIYGSIGSELREPIITGCGGYGIEVLDGEDGWRITGGRVEGITLDAVRLATSTSGVPNGTILDGLTITGSNNGIHGVNGTNTQIRGLVASSNTSSAILLDVGSGSVTVDGAAITGGTAAILVTGGTLATKHTFSAVTISGATTGVQTSYGTTSSFLEGVTFHGLKIVNAGTGPFTGLYVGHGGSFDCYGCTVDFTGATSNTGAGYAWAHAGTTGGILNIFGGEVRGPTKYGFVAYQNGAVARTVNLFFGSGASTVYGSTSTAPTGVTFQ